MHFTDGIKKPCIYCKELTINRQLGLSVCESCTEYENDSKCKQCKYGVEKSEYRTDGFNDLKDYVEHYILCAIRDHYGKIRKEPNYEYVESVFWVNPIEKKKCFTKKG